MFSQIKDIYKTYQTGFSFFRIGNAKGWDLGALGCKGSQKIKHRVGANQIDGDDEQNRMQLKFSPYGQTGDL